MSPTTSVSTILTIGTFDGVHLGHQALVKRARAIAGAGGRVVAVAFAVHPMACLRPDQVPPRLDTVDQRRNWLAKAGADEVELLHPTPELLSLTPEAYIEDLCERHRPSTIVEGEDFHFGRRRAGSVSTLRELGPRLGFATEIVAPVEVALSDQSLVAVRSTLIRWLLHHGRVTDASRCLGREFELLATVVAGDRRGRTIGYPTANLDLADHGAGPRLLPAAGVYAGSAALPDGSRCLAAISIGTKATFTPASAASAWTCEAYLLDHDGPVEDYGWTIGLRFSHWLRDQARFGALEPLLAQIARDVAATRSIGAGSVTLHDI